MHYFGNNSFFLGGGHQKLDNLVQKHCIIRPNAMLLIVWSNPSYFKDVGFVWFNMVKGKGSFPN